MSRSSRKNSKAYTNVYHIILRGINRQELFFDNNDKEKFVKEIKNTKEKYKYQLYAYVLMNNHVHMLVKDEKNCISKIIQSLATSYAMYFNKKYERIGHLFYNRFHSKSVESLNYLLNVQRYIHKNPQKDGIGNMSSYQWSSYQEYMGKKKLVDTEFILSIFSEEKEKAIELWQTYHSKATDEQYSEKEFESETKLNDDEAIIAIQKKLQIENILEIQKYKPEYRDKMIQEASSITGIYREQLARILGINKRMVYRAISKL